MTEQNPTEFLELYKLHADLADRVSQRREGANRLFVSLLTGLMVFLAACLRFGAGDVSENAIMVFFGVGGAILSVAWYVVIRSYRQLNTGKFLALHELEEKLAYAFYKREWVLLGEGKDVRRYWRLTVVETSLPLAFLLLFGAVILFGVLR